MRQQQHNENNKGQLAIITVISASVILLTITLSQFLLGYSEYSQSSFDNNADQALEIAESGIENGIEQYIADNTYTGGTFSVPKGSATVTLSVNNGTNPPQVTVTSVGSYLNITRSETTVFSISPPPPITNETAFSQNNLYTNNSTITGNTFTNNDFNLNSSTFNGSIYGAGKGNGQKGYFISSVINKVNGVSQSLNVWDPTYIQSNSTINGDVNYHTSIHDDGTNTITGNVTKQSVSFIPPIAVPTFTFTQAKTLATTNGTYYANPTAFLSYLSSVKSASGNLTTYNLPSGIYFVDCQANNSPCSSSFTMNLKDGSGNYQLIKGSNVSIIINSSFTDNAGINISSPYSANGGYYPALATNGDETINAPAHPSNPYISITGLLFTNGTINLYGISQENQTTITGGIWTSNQLNFFNYENVTFNSTYVNDQLQGFGFSNSFNNSLSWQENP